MKNKEEDETTGASGLTREGWEAPEMGDTVRGIQLGPKLPGQC